MKDKFRIYFIFTVIFEIYVVRGLYCACISTTKKSKIKTIKNWTTDKNKYFSKGDNQMKIITLK